MALDPERSGWENPDGHKSIQQRGRPMFDPDGRPVTSAPEPEPLTPAERAMFGGQGPAEAAGYAPGPSEVTVTADYAVPHLSHDVQGTIMSEVKRQDAVLTEVHSIAVKALEAPSPAAWAVALDRIVGLTK
jgi:hypothetical protein